MDLRRLQLLRELSVRGSIQAVAASNDVTSSAISQQIRTLEHEVGVPLTRPVGRGVELTDAGIALVDMAVELAVAAERGEAKWRASLAKPSGRVSLQILPTLGEMFLPGLLARMADYPDIDLACSDIDPRCPNFADLTLDFDIVVAESLLEGGEWHDREVTVVHLMSEPLDVAVPADHRLADQSQVTPEDVVDETWISQPSGFAYDLVLQSVAVAAGKPTSVVQRFSDNGIVESLVAAGHGVAILPRFTTRGHISGLAVLPLVGVRARRELLALLRPEIHERASVQIVLELLELEVEKFKVHV